MTEQPGIPPADGAPVPPPPPAPPVPPPPAPPAPPAYQPPAPPAYQQPAPPAPPAYQQPAYQPPAPPAPVAYEQPGYQQPGYQQPGYQQPGYQQPGYPTGAPAADGKNILGILSLIAPFIGLGLVGIILGHLGLSAVKKGQANNRGVALAGTVLSWIFTVVGGIIMVIAILVPLWAAKTVIEDATYLTQFPTELQFPTADPATAAAADPAPTVDASQIVTTDTLFVGDCILDPYTNTETAADGSSQLSGFQVVPCDVGHYGEVFYVGDITLEPYDPDAAYTLAMTMCEEQFAPYVGVDYPSSALSLDPYYPSPEAGAAGSREVTCVGTAFTSDLTGTIEGSGI